MIRAHLPNDQRTTIQVHPGQTVRDALDKAMRRRKLSFRSCTAYFHRTDNRIDWNEDVSVLDGGDIDVRTDELFPTLISHSYVRKTFFTLVICDCCSRFLFYGFRCQTCAIRFHPRCASQVPALCQPLRVDNYYRHLLAINDRNYEAKRTASVTSNPRERSSSEPNISSNIIVRSAISPPPATISISGDAKPKNSSSQSNLRDSNEVTNATREPRARSADGSLKKIRNLSQEHESMKDWEIPLNEILVRECIGSGSFGTVFRGHWHGPVALKKLKVSNPTYAQLQDFKNELRVLRKTRHVNIILFMGYVSEPRLLIVTQWCDGSSLYKHIHVYESQFEHIQMIDIARQTAQGMDYLHAKNIIHRDLKSNSKIRELKLITILLLTHYVFARHISPQRLYCENWRFRPGHSENPVAWVKQTEPANWLAAMDGTGDNPNDRAESLHLPE